MNICSDIKIPSKPLECGEVTGRVKRIELGGPLLKTCLVCRVQFFANSGVIECPRCHTINAYSINK
jgi:hypothetical protein